MAKHLSNNSILLATSNQGKFRELSLVAEEFNLKLVSIPEISSQISVDKPLVEEDRPTFLENAFIKASAYYHWSGLTTIADDSGLEIEALDGFPGVRSARWAGPGKSDKERCQLVLEKMKTAGVGSRPEERKARFHCALACMGPKGLKLEAEAILTGHILNQPQGEGGFGYDPIVFIDTLKATLAQVSFSQTLEHGFRAKAARDLFRSLV